MAAPALGRLQGFVPVAAPVPGPSAEGQDIHDHGHHTQVGATRSQTKRDME